MPFTWPHEYQHLSGARPIVLKLLAEHGPTFCACSECPKKAPVDKIREPAAFNRSKAISHMVARGKKGYKGVAICRDSPLVDAGGH